MGFFCFGFWGYYLLEGARKLIFVKLRFLFVSIVYVFCVLIVLLIFDLKIE